MVAVDSEMFVVCQQVQRLEQGLREESSIDGIAMVLWESGHCDSMVKSEGQRLEPAL